MFKMLVTCEIEQDVNNLKQILAEFADSAQISYLTETAQICERLVAGDIDVCFVDYETPSSRLTSILDISHAHELKTMAIILAEPQNLMAVQQDRRYESYQTLLKPLDREGTLFAIQQTLDDNEIVRTGEYNPTTAALWRRTQPLLAKIFWDEALYGNNGARVRRFDGQHWPSIVQSAIAAGIRGVEKELALPILITPQTPRTDEALHELQSMTGIYRIQNAFESLSTAVILRGCAGYSFFAAERSATVFYPYDIRLPVTQIAHRCYQFCREMKRQFAWSGSIVIGRARPVSGLKDEWSLMREEARKRNFRDQTVYIMGENEAQYPTMTYAPVAEWGRMILDGRADALELEARAFFHANEASPSMTTDYVVNLIYELDRFVTIAMAQLDCRSEDAQQTARLRQQLAEAHRSPEETIRWLRMMAEYCTDCRRATRQSGSALQIAEAYIASNLDGDLSRQTIAEHAHISANYLARLFREQKQTTIAEYILRARMERACGYLAGSSMTVMEIALSVGFSSSTYFSSCFRKCIGMTPQQYRAQQSQP